MIMLLPALLFFSACSVNKFIPQGEKLYRGANLELQASDKAHGLDELQADIQSALSPEPNTSILGMKIGLWAHYKVSKGDSGWVPGFLNDRFGEEPVYLSDVNVAFMKDLIANRCANNGYFYSQIESTLREGKKRAEIDYTVNISYPYTLASYNYTPDSSGLAPLIETAFAGSKIKRGQRFDTDLLKQERQRLDSYLKNRGYYNFNPEYFIFTADTNQYQDRRFDLYLGVKQFTPEKSRRRYKLRNIYVRTDYNSTANGPSDTIPYRGIYFIRKEENFKPRHLRQFITIGPNQLYHKEASDRTTSRLSGLKYYQFAAVNYEPVAAGDSTAPADSLNYLDANILLTPGLVQDIRLELQAVTKSTNFAGPELITTYRHKNIFKGGEVLSFSSSISYERQLGRNLAGDLSSSQFKLNTRLTFPRLLSPWRFNFSEAYSVPRTRINLGYTYQDRSQYFKLNSFDAQFTYFWNTSRHTYWEFTPASLIYTQVNNTTPLFEDILDQNPFLQRNFEDQLIPAITYTFRFNELNDVARNHQFYTSYTLGLGGLLIGGIHALANAENELMGLPYSQYVKNDVDFRYYFEVSEAHTWANRFFVGAGYPYGNSESLPFVKQYFAGGPNSLRAFQVRSLGPGAYQPQPTDNRLSFFDQAGDIRLEANTEYRFPIFSILRGAAFADAGNVWLWNNNPALPGGQFGRNFLSEIAAGAGMGLRLDISVLVIRLDVAHPLRYPYEIEAINSHWEDDLAWNNLVWNFAIGYPF